MAEIPTFLQTFSWRLKADFKEKGVEKEKNFWGSKVLRIFRECFSPFLSRVRYEF